MKALVDSGDPPGLLAYIDGQPAGWCCLAPRQEFANLEHSRTLKRVDDQPVWSIVCFVIDKRFRRRGLMTTLLRAAIDYARQHGAQIVEGYPVEAEGTLTGTAGYAGIASAYRRAGFVEVLRRSPDKPIMRWELQ